MNFYEQVIKYGHRFVFGITKYKAVFLLSLIIGFTPFVYRYIKAGNTYEAAFTVAYEELVRKIYGDRLNKLNALVQQHDYTKTASYLGVSKAEAATIVSIEGKNILGEDLSKDMNTDKIPFVVKIEVKDSAKINLVQRGVLNFLETGNEFLANKSKVKNKEIDEEIAYIDAQLRVMDSLKRKHLSERSENSASGNSAAPSSNTLFQFSYELYKKKQELLRKKEMPGMIQVVDDAIVSRSDSGSLLMTLILGTIVSFFIYLVAILLIIPIINYKEYEPIR